MSAARFEPGALPRWSEEHPLASKALAFIAGGLIFLVYRAVMDSIEPWLPVWLLPAALCIGGLALLIHRLRVPVPQDEPETRLFMAIICVAFGGITLISMLISE